MAIRWRFPPWQAEEGSRLIEYVAQALQPPVQGDEVEEIAVLSRGGVGPFAGGALAAGRSGESNEQAAARCVRDIADDPVATAATAVGEAVAAQPLGLPRQRGGQVRGLR